MRLARNPLVIGIGIGIGIGSLILSLLTSVAWAEKSAANTIATGLAVGAQFDTTHVYVAPQDFDKFVASFIATFGGRATPQGVFTVTPTPSSTMSQLVLTPVGSISVFGFKTPIPFPFGSERTGYLVQDIDRAVDEARAAGADIVVGTFPDPIGRDAVIQWPGGVNMQLYWHTVPPTYPALKTIPENRVYLSHDRADMFIRDFVRFSGGRIADDDANAPGVEIGRPNEHYRRVRIESGFGKITVLVTNGQLPYPYGREVSGYEVDDLDATIAKAVAAGTTVIVPPYPSGGRVAAVVQFPGGYIAEIHGLPH